jgi:hypothetical protein
MISPIEPTSESSRSDLAEPWQDKWIVERILKEDDQSLVRIVRSREDDKVAVLKTLKDFRNSDRRYRLTKEVFALERLGGNKGIPSVLNHNAPR